jgi:hypothetical protein
MAYRRAPARAGRLLALAAMNTIANALIETCGRDIGVILYRSIDFIASSLPSLVSVKYRAVRIAIEQQPLNVEIPSIFLQRSCLKLSMPLVAPLHWSSKVLQENAVGSL